MVLVSALWELLAVASSPAATTTFSSNDDNTNGGREDEPRFHPHPGQRGGIPRDKQREIIQKIQTRLSFWIRGT
ncbi:hypothetical protein PILCRDRAFT_826481 [Piloderma croceum F 1598]|uniref:Secreted protein n=1 Tax=Piloderma croceum (strain F 1598) TaxID=765440 RepID=A0A0C3BG18_PILCF|nr:hypothetical protein PILCRDRAFT_826481 [Piloderma croceum F 1598]